MQIPLFAFERILSAVEGVQNFFLRRLFKPEYVRKGACQMTGQCCQAIGIQVPRSWWDRPRLIGWIQRWHYLRFNFVAEGRQDDMIVYSCQYLTPEMKCGIQRFKPKLCRDFPATPWLGITKLHKGCGFYFAKRGGKDFDEMVTKARHRNFQDDSHTAPPRTNNPTNG